MVPKLYLPLPTVLEIFQNCHIKITSLKQELPNGEIWVDMVKRHLLKIIRYIQTTVEVSFLIGCHLKGILHHIQGLLHFNFAMTS